MKTTEAFKTTIRNYLNQLAEKDPLFAETLKKENKNIEDCCTYILNEVHKTGCNGFEDSEIFKMAVHYYDEDELKPGKKINARVVVNHVVKLTEEEKAEARQKAINETIENEKKKILEKKKPKAIAPAPDKKPEEKFDLFS